MSPGGGTASCKVSSNATGQVTRAPAGHGCSWKQAFFERAVGSRLESFDPAKESVSELQRLLAFSRKHVRSLEIAKLPSHLDLELVFEFLGHGPSCLTLRYGPGDVGMDYERTLFGMKLSDARCVPW